VSAAENQNADLIALAAQPYNGGRTASPSCRSLLDPASPLMLHAAAIYQLAPASAAVMSSNGDTNVVLRGVTHGAVDFLIKASAAPWRPFCGLYAAAALAKRGRRLWAAGEAEQCALVAVRPAQSVCGLQ